jgi:hypothetical protein
MNALFANVTRDEFRRSSKPAQAAARRQRVNALFDEIQLAIDKGDRLKVDYLMAALAEATVQGYRAAVRRDH